ncbi:MAG: hypothetical protein ACE5JA_07830 [bacterium]
MATVSFQRDEVALAFAFGIGSLEKVTTKMARAFTRGGLVVTVKRLPWLL